MHSRRKLPSSPFDQETVTGATAYQVTPWTKYRSPFHTFLIIVIGAMTILLVGIVVGKLFERQTE